MCIMYACSWSSREVVAVCIERKKERKKERKDERKKERKKIDKIYDFSDVEFNDFQAEISKTSNNNQWPVGHNGSPE